MAGLVGLLMALALTATGCQMIPNANLGNAGAQPTPIVPPVKKVADFDPAKATIGEEWTTNFGQDPAVSTPFATAGLKIMSVMFDAHPEYTLGGFVPTDKEWSAVAGEFKPLVNAKAMQYMESEWNADKTLPVMTSYRSKPNKDGVQDYTYTTEAGEKCTYGDKPYEYKTEAVTLSAGTDASGAQVPLFTGNVSVTVHCKEGTLLQGQMFAWFPMVQVDGKWIMFETYEVNPTGPFEMMQVLG
jgi:hypothetical protein